MFPARPKRIVQLRLEFTASMFCIFAKNTSCSYSAKTGFHFESACDDSNVYVVFVTTAAAVFVLVLLLLLCDVHWLLDSGIISLIISFCKDRRGTRTDDDGAADGCALGDDEGDADITDDGSLEMYALGSSHATVQFNSRTYATVL